MKLLLAFVFSMGSAALAFDTWDCHVKTGLFGMNTTRLRLEKDTTGYSAYITAAAGDVGPQWKLDNVKVAEGMQCKFSSSKSTVLYCISQSGNSWTTVYSDYVQDESVDQTTGADTTTKYVKIVVSGSGDVFKNFNQSVFQMAADESNCSSN